LRKKGKSQPYISEVTGLPVTTISDILRRFDKRGINGCYAIKQSGQPKKLSAVQRVKLKKIILNSPLKVDLPFVIWTTKLVLYITNKMFKVEYTLRQIANILKGMGLTLQKARPEHIKTNKKLQAEFKKNFDEELKSLEKVDMRSYFWTRAHSS
jgi:transposase